MIKSKKSFEKEIDLEDKVGYDQSKLDKIEVDFTTSIQEMFVEIDMTTGKPFVESFNQGTNYDKYHWETWHNSVTTQTEISMASDKYNNVFKDNDTLDTFVKNCEGVNLANTAKISLVKVVETFTGSNPDKNNHMDKNLSPIRQSNKTMASKEKNLRIDSDESTVIMDEQLEIILDYLNLDKDQVEKGEICKLIKGFDTNNVYLSDKINLIDDNDFKKALGTDIVVSNVASVDKKGDSKIKFIQASNH